MTRFDDLESLRKDTHLISLEHLTLTTASRSNFHRKMLHFGFSHFNNDLAVYLLGIAPTGEQIKCQIHPSRSSRDLWWSKSGSKQNNYWPGVFSAEFNS